MANHTLAVLALSAFALMCTGKQPDVKETLPETATVTGDNISLRSGPISMASEVYSLSGGTRLKILKKSPEPTRIGKFNQYWYYVELENGMKGWVYGARLSIAGAESGSPDSSGGGGLDQKLADELDKQIIGRWWEIRQDGSTGYRKYVFYPDRKFKYAYGSEYYDEGTYEVVVTRSLVHLEGKGSGLGDNLNMKHVGNDLRLQVEYKGSLYTFRRGDSDPEGKEVTPAEAEAKKARAPAPNGGAKSP